MHEARIRARARALPRAFLEEIARRDLDARTRHAAIAGMIVLRTVDRWVAGGCRAMDVTGARAAVMEMDEGNPARGILERALDEMGKSEDPARVVDHLMLYAQHLENQARWSLALAVYVAVAGYAGVASSAEHVFLAHIRQAVCLRTIGPLDDAIEITRRAQSMATAARNPRWHVQAQLSLAVHLLNRGDLDQADDIMRVAYDEAPESSAPELRASLLNGRGVVAGVRHDYEAVIAFCYQALSHDPTPSERDRILHNIGEGFRNLGYPDAARDAFLILSGTASEQLMRWAAFMCLMLLAAQDGDRRVFLEHRRELERVPLPPWVELNYLQHLALSLRLLGDEDGYESTTRQAQETAARHGFGMARFTLASTTPRQPRSGEARALPTTIAHVASAIRELRESTNVST